METTTNTTTKTRRRRIATGILVTSTNLKTRKTIQFLERLDVRVIRHFNAISYRGIGYQFVTL